MIFDVLTFAVAFLVALVLYPWLIGALRRWRSVQVIQAELPESHHRKAGTPTAGGVLFLVLGIIGGVLAALAGHAGAWPSVAGLVAGGLIGVADDRTKLRVGSTGIPARLKLPVQFVLAVPVAWLALSQGSAHQLWLPQTMWLLFPLSVVAIVGCANAVNLSDGMDGLAAGLSILAVVGIVLLPSAVAGEKAVAMSLAGALLAFLWFNRYPARVFMGDAGALAIGYALAAMAIQQGFLILLPLIGLVFVLETLSVIISLSYFRLTHGRRIFKGTPIHYTFHHYGWSENRIALSFWGVGLVSALAAVGVARLAS
ncbi:MAG TPA: phospho-N-acetylmuramoyl-pentapeptide-transferase [Candidatus Dormibacteraeota bacterium]|nr:phospho-N-acetylmuramoyl-pentapeptide-transferase [Candidatus Dormibacteraeota bacterium]